MDKKSKIAIYYICTGNYKMLFEEFIRTLSFFYPENYKKVILISDGLSEWDDDNNKNELLKKGNYVWEKTINYWNVPKKPNNFLNQVDSNISIEWHKLKHYCWPINTLFKMSYILDYFQEEYDYHFYFNANTTFFHPVTNYTLFPNNKLISTSVQNQNATPSQAMEGYLNTSDSVGYIEGDDYQYARAAFFGGDKESVRKMCIEVDKMVSIDLKNYVIPTWHDECYLNKYIQTHLNDCNVIKGLIGDEYNEGIICRCYNKAPFFKK